MREPVSLERPAPPGNVLVFAGPPRRRVAPRGEPAAIVPLRPRTRPRRERWIALAWWSTVVLLMVAYVLLLAWRGQSGALARAWTWP